MYIYAEQVFEKKLLEGVWYCLEKITENTDQKTLFQLIIERIQKYYHRNRLRNRFVLYTLLAFLLNCYIFAGAKDYLEIQSVIKGILLGILGGMFAAYFDWKHTIKRISGNIYTEFPVGNIYHILRIIIGIGIAYFLYKLNLSEKLFYHVAIPAAVAFFVASLTLLVWLINYERKMGTVYTEK